MDNSTLKRGLLAAEESADKWDSDVDGQCRYNWFKVGSMPSDFYEGDVYNGPTENG